MSQILEESSTTLAPLISYKDSVMLSKKSRVRIRTFHRWIGPIVGIQLLLWIVSGIYFAWISIEDIRGDKNKVALTYSPISMSEFSPPAQLSLPPDFQFKSLKLELTPKGYVYRVESVDEKAINFQASDGVRLKFLTGVEASALALTQLKVKFEVVDTAFVHERPDEYKGPVPAYRIQLNDLLRTRLYTDPWTGKLIVQRNILWRIYDFLWMLHIMDFSTRENFNNPFLRIASFAALGVIISGYLLFAFGRPQRRKAS